MLEKIRDCLIFFIVSDIGFGFFIFLSCFSLFRRSSPRFALFLYIVSSILLLFISVKLAFFTDNFSPHCAKVYQNKDLYIIEIGEKKTLKELSGKNARVSVFYMFDYETYKLDTDELYLLLIDFNEEECERFQLKKTKKEILIIDENLLKKDYKLASDIAIFRKGENEFSIFLNDK